jgi:hypothetical protein
MQWFAPNAGYCLIAGLGFGLFRVFDILKPWPCKRLEKLPAGWGILADDLMAGVYAAFVWIAGQNLGILETFEIVRSVMKCRRLHFFWCRQDDRVFCRFRLRDIWFFESFADGINTESPEMLRWSVFAFGTVI